ncbi:hypothetical protein [Listeria fleischmannii]|uniref:Uncharacterized protein n=1 Tax=Listeria fleischmannii FSL S10-1203 TaxID=1265822 RepID=W7DLV5_9LIST|nr:hypothetical protein [Listeria fleischmannii]EUJ48671.1 hypothetical protein MCOL2_17027 [Listeria fleischmannii FSL S10-1203]
MAEKEEKIAAFIDDFMFMADSHLSVALSMDTQHEKVQQFYGQIKKEAFEFVTAHSEEDIMSIHFLGSFFESYLEKHGDEIQHLQELAKRKVGIF